jgi:hypothetical protein
MVAGAGGVDAVVLVVAADEGVMPQTREHLAICAHLGIRRGIVALTKADLAPDDVRRVAALEVADLLRGTFLESAPCVVVATRTGEGMDALRRELAALFDAAAVRGKSGGEPEAFARFTRHDSASHGRGSPLAGVLLWRVRAEAYRSTGSGSDSGGAGVRVLERRVVEHKCGLLPENGSGWMQAYLPGRQF